MTTTQRISISIKADKANSIRQLVDQGKFESISSAYAAAADVLIEREKEAEAWWAETIRRCEAAENHPERLLDAETFHKLLWSDIARMKAVAGKKA